MTIYQKNIYRIHFKNNSYPAFLYWVAFALLVSIFCILSGSFLQTRQDSYETKKSLDYSYAIESSDFNEEYLSYYKLSNLVSISRDDEVIHANFYVQTNSQNNVRINGIKLKNGEIAISKKIADELNVSTGDTIEIMLPMYVDASTYTVSEITPYVDDYYDFEDDYDFSVAVVGYDETVITNANGVYVGFLSDDMLNAFMAQELSYNQMYYVLPELELERSNLIMLEMVFMLISMIIFAIYTIIINAMLKSEWRKYFIEGLGVKCTRKIILLDKTIFNASLGVFVSLLMLVISLIGIVHAGYALVIVGIHSMLSIANLLWRDKYGKAL